MPVEKIEMLQLYMCVNKYLHEQLEYNCYNITYFMLSVKFFFFFTTFLEGYTVLYILVLKNLLVVWDYETQVQKSICFLHSLLIVLDLYLSLFISQQVLSSIILCGMEYVTFFLLRFLLVVDCYWKTTIWCKIKISLQHATICCIKAIRKGNLAKKVIKL